MRQLYGVTGEVMVGQYALDPTVIDRHVVAVPNNLGWLAHGKRMGDRQPNDLRLDRVGQPLFNGRLAPRLRPGALLQHPKNPRTLQAPQVPPETPIIKPRVLALLAEGAFPCQDGTQRFITG